MKTLFRTLVLIVLSACTFNSDELYYKDITVPVVKGSITINVDAKNDTILIYNPTTFSVDFNASGGRIEKVEIFLKDQLLKTLYDPQESFAISQNQFRSGFFDLVLKMQVDSQTGSIANRSGGERTIIERRYKLKIDADPPPAPILTRSEQNGFLQISWTPYTKPNFVSYRLSIQTPNNTSRTITITDPTATSFVDSAYTGGYSNSTRYSVTTNAIGSITRTMSVSNALQLFYTYNTADSTARLTWRKMPYLSAFKEYVVKENGVDRMRLTNIADTAISLKLNAVLNMQSSLQLEVQPKFPDAQYPSATQKQFISNTVRGKQIPSNITGLVYNETFQNFFARRQPPGERLFTVRFDRDFNPIDSFDARGVIPFRGSHFYYAFVNTVMRRDWLSGARESVLINFSGVTPSIAAATSTGMVVATWQTARTSTQPAKFYSRLIDIPTGGTAWDVVTFFNSHTTPDVSSNAKYIYSPSQGILAQLSGSVYTSLTTFSSSSSMALDFRPDNEEELLQINKIEGLPVYNTALTLIRTISAPEAGYQFESYDPVSKYALFSKTDAKVLYAVNIDTNEVRPITAYKTSGISYRLLNGYLFSGTNYFKIF